MMARSFRLPSLLRSLASALFALLVLNAPAAQAAPFAYVTNFGPNTVSVIDVATNAVTATVAVGTGPFGVAVTPDGTRVYVANANSNNVSVISTATNTVTATVAVGTAPRGVAVTPDGTRVYVANLNSNNVSVISTATNTVTTTVPVGTQPFGLAVTPDGTRVYVANNTSNNVSVISTPTNTVTATVAVGNAPIAFGLFITPSAGLAIGSSNSIPTLSEWMLIVLAGLLGFEGMMRLRRI